MNILHIAYNSVKWRTNLARTGVALLQMGRQNHRKDQNYLQIHYTILGGQNNMTRSPLQG